MASKTKIAQGNSFVFCSALAFALAANCSIASSALVTDAMYGNPRYGFSIHYPSELLAAEPESDNGDGRKFHARHGSARIAVWAGDNALNQTPAAIARDAEEDCGRRPAVYRLVKPTVVAVSCITSTGGVVYRKTLIRGDILTSLLATYSASERSVWDPVVQRMAQSLTPGRPD